MKNLYIFMAHLDDFECACLSYLSKFSKNYENINLLVASQWLPKEKITLENIKIIEELNQLKIVYKNLGFDQRRLLSNIDDLKEKFYSEIDFKLDFDILTHSDGDAHTDHQAVSTISRGMLKYAQNYTTVYSPSSYGFDPNMFVNMSEDQFKVKKICLDKYDISKEQSFTKLGYYLQSDEHYNIGKAYFLERFANKHNSKYAEVYRIEKITLL